MVATVVNRVGLARTTTNASDANLDNTSETTSQTQQESLD